MMSVCKIHFVFRNVSASLPKILKMSNRDKQNVSKQKPPSLGSLPPPQKSPSQKGSHSPRQNENGTMSGKLWKKSQDAGFPFSLMTNKWLERNFTFDSISRILHYSDGNDYKGSLVLSSGILAKAVTSTDPNTDKKYALEISCKKVNKNGSMQNQERK
jgi:hypothetical protein